VVSIEVGVLQDIIKQNDDLERKFEMLEKRVNVSLSNNRKHVANEVGELIKKFENLAASVKPNDDLESRVKTVEKMLPAPGDWMDIDRWLSRHPNSATTCFYNTEIPSFVRVVEHAHPLVNAFAREMTMWRLEESGEKMFEQDRQAHDALVFEKSEDPARGYMVAWVKIEKDRPVLYVIYTEERMFYGSLLQCQAIKIQISI